MILRQSLVSINLSNGNSAMSLLDIFVLLISLSLLSFLKNRFFSNAPRQEGSFSWSPVSWWWSPWSPSKALLVLAPQSLPGSYTPPKRLTSIDKLPPYSRRGVFHNPPPQICLAPARLGFLSPSPSRPATVRFSHS